MSRGILTPLGVSRKVPSSDDFEYATYSRPDDWVAVTAPSEGTQKIVMLHAVFPHTSNFISFKCEADYHVDWGDGNEEDVSSGVQAEHAFDYDDAAFDGTASDRGYKQAIITITPQGGNDLEVFDVRPFHSEALDRYSSGILEIYIAGENLDTLYVGSTSSTEQNHDFLEYFEYIGDSALTSCADLFRASSAALRKVVGTAWTSGVTSMSRMFDACYSLIEVDAFVISASCTNFSRMFVNCNSLERVPTFGGDTSGVTSWSIMFSGCNQLRSVPDYDTSGGTNFAQMFASCYVLRSAPALDLSNIGGGSVSSMFLNCYALEEAPDYDFSGAGSHVSLFAACRSLKTVPAYDFTAATAVSSMFSGCDALTETPAFTGLASCTSFNRMFNGCNSLRKVALFDTSGATTINRMFTGCTRLQEVPAFDFSGVTNNAGGVFNNCRSLEVLGDLDLGNATSVTTNSPIFDGCESLSALEMSGIALDFSIEGCKFGRDELVALFESLPDRSATTSKTLTITDNWGVADLDAADEAIATDKNWVLAA